MSLPDPRPADLEPGPSAALCARYTQVRGASVALTRTLAPEDCVVQSMPDASPTKWHLAHTSWFFETFLLGPRLPGYAPFDARFHPLFNSYYYSVGQMYQRPRRGLLSRPTLAEVLAYRSHVDEHMQRLIEREAGDPELDFLVSLGLNHEQQHQELILTDIKHVLAQNPLRPAFRELPEPARGRVEPLRFERFDGGLVETGAMPGGEFVFDNETPRHRAFLEAFELATRPVINAEYAEFIADGGYTTPDLWLSDGWAVVCAEGWRRPLYWDEDLASEFTLGGLRAIAPQAPATHLSFYEADAFARWAGARLPSEAEWEHVAASHAVAGNFVESGWLHPARSAGPGLGQLYGDVWEWTASAYRPYPGFRPLAGSLGEYNGKFMCNQMVLRGGSCASPADHLRASYRNFFYPHQRWQFTGLRLAKDGVKD